MDKISDGYYQWIAPRAIPTLLISILVLLVLNWTLCGFATMGDSPLALANLSGDYKDQGTDANHDGKFEFLSVDVGVNVFIPGEYSVTGSLFDKRNREVVWSIDHERLNSGHNTMHLDFDGKAIQSQGQNESYSLKDVKLVFGNMYTDMIPCDIALKSYNTSFYNYSDFIDPVRTGKKISGSGSGDLLFTIMINKVIPVFSGEYSLDVIGINIPPFSSDFNVTGESGGYGLNMGGIYLPGRPNNFTVSARGVKNVNVGLKKLQGSYENSSMVFKGKYSRIWVTTQIPAEQNGTAVARSDLLSPGIYHAKIFGDAAENVSQVDLTMTLVKKMVVKGKFSLGINTTGFPAGNYSMTAKALNGSLRLDELAVDGLSMDN